MELRLPHSRFSSAVTIAVLGAVPVLAQQAPPPPPTILQIGIETVQPGRGSSHTALETQWADAYRKAGVPVYWLGTDKWTGTPEAWFFSGFASWAEYEAQGAAIDQAPGLGRTADLLGQADGANLSGSRSVVARYRPDLSHVGGTPAGAARYFSVSTWRVRPGHEEDFASAAKLYATVVKEANADEHWVTYQVESGMPTPTFMVISTHKSLAEMDPGPSAAALNKAMTAERQKLFTQFASNGFGSVENTILRFNPKTSYLPNEMAAMDPKFWGVTP